METKGNLGIVRTCAVREGLAIEMIHPHLEQKMPFFEDNIEQ